MEILECPSDEELLAVKSYLERKQQQVNWMLKY